MAKTKTRGICLGLCFGSPCWARTSDTLINSQVLVPTELRRNMKGIHGKRVSLYVGYDLSFRVVSNQVFSALQSLTSVFGMGTGGPSTLKTPTIGAPSGIQPRDASRSHMIRTAVALATLSASRKCAVWCTFRDSNPGPTD